MTPKIISYRGDELFRTDADGKPIVPEDITKERLAEALLDCMNYVLAPRTPLEKEIDAVKRGIAQTLFPGQTLELVPFGVKIGNIGITAE